MLVEGAVLVVSTVLALFIGKVIATTLGQEKWPAVSIQMGVAGGFGAGVAASFGLSVELVAIGTALVPLGVNILAIINNHRQRRTALSGGYGEEVKWAAELKDNGDRHFELAVSELPDHELMEVGVIADSKDELRERTIERFEEKAEGESIPEDFTQ